MFSTANQKTIISLLLVSAICLLDCNKRVGVVTPTIHEHAFGLPLQIPEEYYRYPISQLRYDSLPTKIELTRYLPQVGYQGNQGSCVAWAAGYAARGYLMRMRAKWTDSDGYHLMSPAFLFYYSQLGSCSGAYITTALSQMSSIGCCTMARMNYDPNACTDPPSQGAILEAQQFKIVQFSRLSIDSLNQIKAHLASGIPIIVGMRVGPIFVDLKFPNNIYKREFEYSSGHAVCMTGFNDNLRAFRIMNSWGGDWGDLGYAWIDYDFFRQTVDQLYVIWDSASVSDLHPIFSHSNPSTPEEAIPSE